MFKPLLAALSVLLLVGCDTFDQSPIPEAPSSTPWGGTQWEYRIERVTLYAFPSGRLETNLRLNAWGAHGWEVAGISYGDNVVVLQRPRK